MDKTIAIPQEVLSRIKVFIAGRSGLYFSDCDLRELENVIALRMKANNIDSAFFYLNHLTLSGNKENELRELLNFLTVNHTYFFRNEPHFAVLKDRVLPEIIEQKSKAANSRLIRIWSAGCSTGEEPYTIAMVIRDIIPDIENWDIQIIATDASESVLKIAQKGLYGAGALKLVDEGHLKKYFIRSPEGGYVINDEIKRMVNFGFFNLMDKEYPVGFDIIFCRNVTIYFEFAITLEVMNKFHSSLNEDGYLFIGYSETMRYSQDKFEMVCLNDAIYYRKLMKGIVIKEAEEILEDIFRAELETELTKEEGLPPSPKRFEDVLVQVVKAMHLKEYPKAIEFIEEAISINDKIIEPYYLAAEVFVNQGKFQEAKTYLITALRLNPMFAPAHYLMGCIYMEDNEIEKARESFRKALYLDKDFLLAHFYLGQLNKLEGRIDDAIKGYRNTLKLLSGLRMDAIIAYSGGLGAATLMNVCRNNLERLR